MKTRKNSAFDWNLLAPALGLTSHDPDFDKLFAFGIDPVDGGLPTDVPEDWPSIVRVETYNWRVRTQISDALQHPTARVVNTREIAGKPPAWTAPKRNRIVSKNAKP